MPNPQNPELRRSEEILRPRPDLGPDPDDVGGGEGRPVPPENRRGHSPDRDQDKPPADEFARALGIDPDAGDDQGRKRADEDRGDAEDQGGDGAGEASGQEQKPSPGDEPDQEPEREPGEAVAAGAEEAEADDDLAELERAAREHDHATADAEVPHEPGFVTPSGAPITARVLTMPVRCATTVATTAVRTTGGVLVYGLRVARSVGGRFGPGR